MKRALGIMRLTLWIAAVFAYFALLIGMCTDFDLHNLLAYLGLP